MTATSASRDSAGPSDNDIAVRFHSLTFAPDGGEVTVGRTDIDEYCVLPADGAALLERMVQGSTPRAAAEWYERTYGDPVDMADFLDSMGELGFVAGAGEVVQPAADAAPVRWQRLGAAVFSPVGAVCFLALLAGACWSMTRDTRLVPHYRNLIFSRYITVVELVTFVGQFPLLLLHESFHALAGRRLGLRSHLGVGRRLYFIVVETSLDGLVLMPRRRRYLPILAGMLADLLAFAVLTLAAYAAGPGSSAGRICLALAFATLLRLVWQFYFYLGTDLYYVVTTVTGCVDLQGTAHKINSDRWRRWLHRRPRHDPSTFHPRDTAVARWYSWLVLAGYAFSLTTLVVVLVPTGILVFSRVLGRLDGAHPSTGLGVTDSIVFLALNAAQLALIAWLLRRERRLRAARPHYDHVLS